MHASHNTCCNYNYMNQQVLCGSTHVYLSSELQSNVHQCCIECLLKCTALSLHVHIASYIVLSSELGYTWEVTRATDSLQCLYDLKMLLLLI